MRSDRDHEVGDVRRFECDVEEVDSFAIARLVDPLEPEGLVGLIDGRGVAPDDLDGRSDRVSGLVDRQADDPRLADRFGGVCGLGAYARGCVKN